MPPIPHETVIRKATGADAPAAWLIRNASIWQQCSAHYPADLLELWTRGELTEAFITMVEDSFHVAIMDDQVVATGMIDLESGKLDAIFVHPDHMGTGLGKQMLLYLENLAIEAGLAEMHLESTLNATGFYRGCGFTGEGISSYQSPRGISLDCVLMKKNPGK